MAPSCKISSCPKLFSDINYCLSSWAPSFENIPGYSHNFWLVTLINGHSTLDIFWYFQSSMGLLPPHSRQYKKKLSAYYTLNIMPNTVYLFSFILTNILWDRYHCYSHLIREQDWADKVFCPGHSRMTESQMSLCFKSSMNLISKLFP